MSVNNKHLHTCNNSSPKCVLEACKHSEPHAWNLDCATVNCTFYSNKVCASCQEKETCGTLVQEIDGKPVRSLNSHDPRIRSPRPHVHSMKCEKFAAVAIPGCACVEIK